MGTDVIKGFLKFAGGGSEEDFDGWTKLHAVAFIAHKHIKITVHILPLFFPVNGKRKGWYAFIYSALVTF